MIPAIGSIANSTAPSVRFIRTVKSTYINRGDVPSHEAVPHEITHQRLANIIPSGMQAECNREAGREGYYVGATRILLRALKGEKVSSFYADYEIHPDDTKKGLALAESL
jgi:hypothetical protein